MIILRANTCFAQVSYSTFNYPGAAGDSTFLTGVRGAGGGDIYITGTYEQQGSTDTQGLLYQGPLSGVGQWTILNFPGADITGTALYGPDSLAPDSVRLVGSYKQTETGQQDHGLLYEGPPDGTGSWQTIDFPSMGETVLNTIAHSTMGGLVVGNFDTNLATGRAFVYDIDNNSWVELVKPGAVSITAYGIWYNGGTQYTIAGGTVTQTSLESTMATWWIGIRRHKPLRTGRPTTLTIVGSALRSRISTALQAITAAASI